MIGRVWRSLGAAGGGWRLRLLLMLALLVLANGAAWVWAFAAFRQFPALLGTAVLAYSFGARHAVDADHIAAIDNVTRSLMQQGKRPLGIGFCFSLGHSTVVFLATVAIAASASSLQQRFPAVHAMGGALGTLISALFLFALAGANLLVLRQVWRAFRRVRRGGAYIEEDLSRILQQRGLLGRLFRPLFALIGASWHMYPLGFLFGLGFDTATEIGLLGIAAAEASNGLPIWSILVFPALFAAGMALVDTADSLLMLGAYGWAFIKPLRKLYYNLILTMLSVLAALLIGGIETLGLVADRLGAEGVFWRAIGALNANFGTLGLLVILVFAASWALAVLVYRLKGYDRIEVGSG
jgi:nickel/cobalt transporter (NiCoT) family protein